MIGLEDATLGGARGRLVLGPVSLTLGGGAHAFVGAAHEGGPALLAAMGAAARLRSGRVTCAVSRDRVAYVPAAPLLPPGLTVREVVTLAARLHKKVGADPLDRFALGVLAGRRVDSLTHGEAHAIALLTALSIEPRVLLLEEPLAHLDARAAPPIIAALRAHAASGAAVVIATASERDARALGADVWSIRGGLCVRRPAAPFADLSRVKGFTVRVDDPPRLSAALDGVAETRIDGGALVVLGDDALSLAAAIASAVDATGVRIDALEPTFASGGKT